MTGIDINCMLGHWPFRKLYKNSFEDLQKVHRDNNIDFGFVSSLDSIFYNDPFEGDIDLHETIKGSSYRHILTVNPLLPGYKDDIEKGVLQFDIKGVKVYPGYHGYKLDDGHFQELCNILKQFDLPLFLNLRMEDERLDYIVKPSIPKMGEVGRFLSDNRDLKVFLLTFRNEELLQIKDGLLSHPNAFYDTSGLKNGLFAIEKSVADFGPDRIVYGSQHPLFCFKSTHLLVTKSQLDEQIRNKILYHNILSVFGSSQA